MTTSFQALLLLALIAGCRSRSSAPTPEPATKTAKLAPSASGSAGAKLEPPAPTPSASHAPTRDGYYPPAPEPLDAACQAALGRARKLQAELDFEGAKAEFLRASGDKQTINLQPLVELGYLKLGRDSDEAETLLYAGTGSGDATLEAQAWFNLATLHASRGDVEGERAALARSLSRRENKSARAKLRGRSLCVAEVSRTVAASPAVVSGWPGVCSELQLCDSDTLPAAEARQQACLESSFSAAEPDKSHGCPGAGPWDSTFRYSWFSYDNAWIAPLAKDRFFVELTRVGSWPATCRGSVSPSWKQLGPYALATLEHDALTQLPGRPIPQADPENGVCLEGPGTTQTAVFKLDTGALLGAVSVVAGHPVNVSFDEASKRLVLSGGGCDGYVPADGSFRFVPLSPR